jgi:ATP synthase protein I
MSDKGNKFDNPWRMIGLVSVIGVDLAVSVLAGYWIGQYVDNWLETTPIFMLIGLLLGLGAGVYSVYLIIRSYL